MQRIVVFGASGSGKTTLARRLSERLELPLTDLDDVYWRPNWIADSIDEFRESVDNVTRGQRWVVAGNYSKARDLLWPRADALIWLDLPLAQSLWRTTRRAWRQSRSGELICNGNRQTLAALVKPPNSLLGYTLRTFHIRRLEYPKVLKQPQLAHAHIFRLRSASEVTVFQQSIQPGNTPVDR